MTDRLPQRLTEAIARLEARDNLPPEPYSFVGEPITPRETHMTHANKAVLAAVLAGLAYLVAQLQAKAPVTALDWVVTVLAAVVTGLTVYVVPNQPQP